MGNNESIIVDSRKDNKNNNEEKKQSDIKNEEKKELTITNDEKDEEGKVLYTIPKQHYEGSAESDIRNETISIQKRLKCIYDLILYTKPHNLIYIENFLIDFITKTDTTYKLKCIDNFLGLTGP